MIKFTGYLTEVNIENKSLKNIFIGLRIFELESNKSIDSLYDMLENGQHIEVILDTKSVLKEPYTIINANCVSGLQREVEEKLKAGYLPLGAPFWREGNKKSWIFQAMIRGEKTNG